MIFIFVSLVVCQAIWPFETPLNKEISSSLIEKLLLELGHSAKEISLIGESYLKANPDLSELSLIESIQEGKFEGFIKEWKFNLFSSLLPRETIEKAKELKTFPLTYEFYQSLAMDFEEFTKTNLEKLKEIKKSQDCNEPITSSYHI